MEGANKYDTESSLSTYESNAEPESESSEFSSEFYHPAPNEKMFNNSNNLFGSCCYMGSPNMDYGYSQQGSFLPYGYYDFDGNFCGIYNHGMYLSKEVNGTEYYAHDFNLPMHPYEMNSSIQENWEDPCSWNPDIKEQYYNGYSNRSTVYLPYGLTNAEGQSHYFQTSDSYDSNPNSYYFGTGSMEPYFPQQECTFPYVWYASEVPGYYFGYETNDHTIAQNEDISSKC